MNKNLIAALLVAASAALAAPAFASSGYGPEPWQLNKRKPTRTQRRRMAACKTRNRNQAAA
jgi:hypothetical protein